MITNSKMIKAAHEILVFTEFTKVSGLKVDPKSVESRNEPEPDIRCVVSGVRRYFELGRLLDSEIPRLRIEMIRQSPKFVPIDVSKFGLPERDVLKRKLAKKYETHGCPVDLVLYYDWGPDAGLTASAPPPMDLTPEFIENVMLPELTACPGRFDTIWIYERIRRSVLFRLPKGSLAELRRELRKTWQQRQRKK
jgi:hypothetical protein